MSTYSLSSEPLMGWVHYEPKRGRPPTCPKVTFINDVFTLAALALCYHDNPLLLRQVYETAALGRVPGIAPQSDKTLQRVRLRNKKLWKLLSEKDSPRLAHLLYRILHAETDPTQFLSRLQQTFPTTHTAKNTRRRQ
jgi:hypothetical protein